jgi:Zn-dependent protease
MFRSWKLGTAFGIGIYVHWSFLLLPAVVLLWSWQELTVSLALFILVLLVAMFGCVVLHELGHALMARYFGIGTRDITLSPIGGIARMERMSEQPGEEILIALAGPAVNFVITGLLLALGVILLSISLLSGIRLDEVALKESFGISFLMGLIVINLTLGCFNLLPAFPMDGGRVLRAVLALFMDRLRATVIATRLAVVVAMLLCVLPFFGWSPLVIVLALFVIVVGQQEVAALRYHEAQRRAGIEVNMPGDADVIDAVAADEPTFSGFVWDGQARRWVVWRDGRPVTSFSARPE